MNFSIHTREADNGFILNVSVTGLRLSRKLKPCHEVYTDWGSVKQRIEELVGEFAGRLGEMIPEKSFKKDEVERISSDRETSR